MRLWPVPSAAHLPPVDDVADEIDRFGVHVTKHVEDQMGLAVAGSQMEVREEERPVVLRPGVFGQARLAREFSRQGLFAQIPMSVL